MPSESTIYSNGEREPEVEKAATSEQRPCLASRERHWLDQVIGSMRGKPAFEEIVALGRAHRELDRPPEGDES